MTLLVLVLAAGCGSPSEPRDAGAAPASGAQTTTGPPWPAPTQDVAARVAAAGLDLGPMGTAEHYHPMLRVVVEGEPVPVAPGIGVDPTTGAMSAVHTHEGDGTIHVESDAPGAVYTLGQLFTQWGVELGPDAVGGVRAPDGVRVLENGRVLDGDPAEVRLRPDQELVLEVS